MEAPDHTSSHRVLNCQKTQGKKKTVSFKNVFYEEEKIINFITSTLGNTSF